MSADEQFYGQLCWALRRLAMRGESADPHVRYEANTQAKNTLGELARQVGPSDTEMEGFR